MPAFGQTTGSVRSRVAAVCWIAAGSIFLGAEALGAVAFTPRYSYARNYISDLGVPTCGALFDGRAICSPRHALVNAAFVAVGILFAAAALAIRRQLTKGAGRVFVGLSLLNGVGMVLISVFPETDVAGFGSGATYHVVGAGLAILCGNGAILASAFAFARLTPPKWHRVVSVVFPLVAFAAVIVLAIPGLASLDVLGVWERVSVYAITVWELVTGFYLLGNRRAEPAAEGF